ncbi:hypothetical protein MMC34_008538, partial [Xylographa carneopallida]|nr:hypothetical protein [Xylographa carneopallida]
MPPLLALLVLLLSASLRRAVAQPAAGSSLSTAIPLSSGAQYRGALDSNVYQPTYAYFNFTVSTADLALETLDAALGGVGTDLLFYVEALAGADPTYLGLVVTDPAGVVYADDTSQGVEVASVQITSATAILNTTQTLLPGVYTVQVVAETANQFPGGSKYYQLTAQLQPRTLLKANTATPLLLPASFNGTFPAGTVAHADYAATSAPFYILVTSAAAYNNLAAVAPWLFWEQSLDGADVALDDALELDNNYITGPNQPYNYQLFWYAGDSTCQPSCYLHFLALSQYTVSAAAISILPTAATDLVTPLSASAPTTFTATAASTLYYFSFTLSQPQVTAELRLSGGGTADIYVAPAAVHPTVYVDQSSAVWSGTAYTARNEVTLQPSDAYFYTSPDLSRPGRQISMAGTYYAAVLVLNPGSTSQFTLSLAVTDALSNTSATVLPLGASTPGTASDVVTAGVAPIKYYTFTVPDTLNTNASDLVVSLTTACADLYLSDVVNQPGPSTPSASVYSSTQPASDVLVLTGAFGELHSGPWWVGVALSPAAAASSSSASCSFALSVSFDVRAQVTLNTRLQEAPLAAGVLRYYDVYTSQGGSVDFRAMLTSNSNNPVSLYATMNQQILNGKPAYSDPSPFVPGSYLYSTTSNGSEPVVSLLALNTRGSVLQLPTYCQAPAGCVQTLAVFAPFGSAGLPAFLLEVQPFFTETLTTLNDSTPAVASAASLQSQDLAYTLSNSSATCTIELDLLSSASGGPGVLLCVVKNIGETWLFDNARSDCDWELWAQSASTASLSVTFNATSPVLTGALPQYNNVAGTSMAGSYHMLALTLDSGATPSGLNATYSVTQSCLPYPDSLNAPVVSAPLVSAQPVQQTIEVSAISYYTLDLSQATVDANTDVTVVVTGANARLPGAPSPLILLSWTQNGTLVNSSNLDFASDQSDGSELQLITQLSYPGLSSAPLYLSVQALPSGGSFFGRPRPSAPGPLTYTISATVSQRGTLSPNTPFTVSASPNSPLRYFSVLLPTTSNLQSAVFSIVAANVTAAPQMAVLSDPQVDPSFEVGYSYSYALNYNSLSAQAPYSAGGLVLFNNQPCYPVAAGGACRYVVAVYTPTPTAYTLLLSGVQDNAVPAPVLPLTADAALSGSVGAAGVAFYQFFAPYNGGVVNVSVACSSGSVDLLVGPGNRTGVAYTTNAQDYYSDQTDALFWTNGTAAVKSVTFGSADVAVLGGYYAVTVLGLVADTQYSLSVQFTPPFPLTVTALPLANRQQVAGVVSSTDAVTYAVPIDGSAGVNSDVVVLLQPDLSRAVLGVRSELEFVLSTSAPSGGPLYGLYWNSLDASPQFGDNILIQPALQPVSFVLNAQSGPECANCLPFDPTANQTLFVTVFASTAQSSVGTGGPFLLSVTYAPRVALTQSGPSYSGGALSAGLTQTFTYTPVNAASAAANFYVSVSTSTGAAGAVALFANAPLGVSSGNPPAGVAPFQPSSTAFVDQASTAQPTLYQGDPCYYDTLDACVWYLQVLALSDVSGYTITVTEPPPSTNIVPGVPAAVSLPSAASCSQVVFTVPLSQGASSLSFQATTQPANSAVSMFLDDDTLSFANTGPHFADSNSAYWQTSSITAQPISVTPSDSLFGALSITANTSGNYYATLCAQAASSVSLTVGIAQQLPVAPLSAAINGAPVIGSVAAASSAYTSVSVATLVAASTSSLTFTLTSPSSGLLLFVSPSYYPGPTALAPYSVNFSASAYETSIGFSAASSSYPPLTLLATAGSGKVKLTAGTTYYVALYNTGASAATFSLAVSAAGVVAASPPASSTGA